MHSPEVTMAIPPPPSLYAGYTEVGRVPKGARNIRVEEQGPSSNYLAVQGAGDGEFFLNGDWLVQWSGEYAAAGTTLFYQRQGERDTLHAPGPTKQELVLYVSGRMCDGTGREMALSVCLAESSSYWKRIRRC
ncbi:hypothetical protein HPB48_007383 [Haemaphysalis longicornis]|uniref:ADAMTS/ADAMTS-like Spacer 1 domain-containing protein n=1 Tax=Haemaphysalis longicornis TaxID=44386 RepID=A0A9J6G6X5_HAELO|nr:hypothetical protein HPB48_007383 [Haemaphysalis longicornis]